MDALLENLKKSKRNITRKVRFFPVRGVNSLNFKTTLDRADELRNDVAKYETDAIALLRNLKEEMTQDEITSYNEETEQLVESVSRHCINLEDRAAEVAREIQNNNSNLSEANSVQEALREERRLEREHSTEAAKIKARNVCSHIDADLLKVESEIRDHSCLLYTSPSPRVRQKSRMPSSA